MDVKRLGILIWQSGWLWVAVIVASLFRAILLIGDSQPCAEGYYYETDAGVPGAMGTCRIKVIP